MAGDGSAGPARQTRSPSGARAGPPAEAVPGLPCDAQGPVFAQPWQAQAFAMTLALHERGVFSWTEWASYLSRAIGDAQKAGDPDHGDTYYQHWLAALEALVRDKGLASPLVLTSLRHAWAIAAEKTPHGQPVVLAAATRQRLVPGARQARAQSPTSDGPL